MTQQGLHLTEPNNLFQLQNEVTEKLNEFIKKRERYFGCNDLTNNTKDLVNPSCSASDNFSEVDNAYINLMDSVTTLDKAMERNQQKNDKAISHSGYQENVIQIDNNINNIKDFRKKLDQQLEVFQKDVFQNNEPKLELKSSQLIYLISVIAVFCLIYYIIVM